MKPFFEKVIPSTGCSWRFVKYSLSNIDFNWHYHSDYEICLTLNSQGLRYVGNSIEKYNQAELVLIGPEIPHTWHSGVNVDGSKQTVFVAQLPKAWLHSLIDQTPELHVINRLLQAANQGVVFSNKTTKLAIEIFKQFELASPFARYTKLMQLLFILNDDQHANILLNNYYRAEGTITPEVDKLNKVIDHINQHFTEPLCADELAEIAHMSTNYFCRFFKKRTERSVTEFINQLRIGHACKLLVNSNLPISLISSRSGFSNVSNFNRRFLLLKHVTPSQFRKKIKAPPKAS